MIAETITKVAGEIAGKIIDYLSKKEDIKTANIELEKLKKEIELKTIEELTKIEQIQRDFFIKYEGEAEKLPTFVKVLRGSFRTIVSYFFMLIFMLFVLNDIFGFGINIKLTEDFMFIFKLVIAFWFGDRLVIHFLDKLKK